MLKPLSERKDFNTAIVLSGVSDSAPGCSGPCELGIRTTRRATKFWNWCDEIRAECVTQLPGKASLRDIVRRMVTHECTHASIQPSNVVTRGIAEVEGQILALAWSDEQEHHDAALVLSNIPMPAIKSLAEGALVRGGISLDWASYIVSIIYKENLKPLDIPEIILESKFQADLAQITLEYQQAIQAINQAKREAEAIRTKKVAPFLSQIKNFYNEWKEREPPFRYGGAPLNSPQLLNYIENYIIRTGTFPKGTHVIPAGRNRMSGNGSAFKVDFF